MCSNVSAWEKLRKSFVPPPTPSLTSTNQSKELEALRTELQVSLSIKLRKSFLKSVQASINSSLIKLFLQFNQEEVNANKDIIASLKTQIDILEKERDTLSEMQPHLQEGQLLNILRAKDQQIVKLETQIREKDKIVDFLRERIAKMEKEISTYAHIVEVKDRSIVKLSNDLHEFDLHHKIEQQLATPITTGSSANGSQHFVFYEKVAVGCQTESEKQKESLQDMVSAFLMQNKFLNKEVLELNQLRQQGIKELFLNYL